MSHTTFPLAVDPDWIARVHLDGAAHRRSTGGRFRPRRCVIGRWATSLIVATGMSHDTGAAYVFHTSSEGSWSTGPATPTATLTVPTLPEDKLLRFLGHDLARRQHGHRRASRKRPGCRAICSRRPRRTRWSDSSSPASILTHAAVEATLGQSTSLSSDGAAALIEYGQCRGLRLPHVLGDIVKDGTASSPPLPMRGTFDDFSQVALSADGTDRAHRRTHRPHVVFLPGPPPKTRRAKSWTGITLERFGAGTARFGQAVALSGDGPAAFARCSPRSTAEEG